MGVPPGPATETLTACGGFTSRKVGCSRDYLGNCLILEMQPGKVE